MLRYTEFLYPSARASATPLSGTPSIRADLETLRGETGEERVRAPGGARTGACFHRDISQNSLHFGVGVQAAEHRVGAEPAGQRHRGNQPAVVKGKQWAEMPRTTDPPIAHAL